MNTDSPQPGTDPRGAESVQKARVAALRMLGRRDYTAAELSSRLVTRGHTATDVEVALRRLAGEGLVDDRRVTAAFIRVASRVKGRGRIRIERDLQARGVAPDIIREAMASLPDHEDDEAIERLLDRRSLPARLTLVDRRRLFQQLQRRGFPAEAIDRALRKREDLVQSQPNDGS